MRGIIIAIFLSASFISYAQELDFRKVDSATYQLYLQEDWKALIKEGKQALRNEFDYYYLQMRIAYAYYSLKQYRKSARYYKKALQHNSYDPLAREFLYYSYSFGGREMDALWQTRNLSTEQKAAMGIKDSTSFVGLGANYAYMGANTAPVQDAIVSGNDLFTPGTQKATHSMQYAQLMFAHRIGTGAIFEHNGNYLHKNELSYVVSNYRAFLSEEQPVSQVEYNLNTNFRIAEGLTLRPGLHYLYTSIPLYSETEYGQGSGMNRTAVSDLVIKDWVKKIQLSYQVSLFDVGLSYVNHDINDIHTHQLGIHGTIYPLGNLNLYLGADAYMQLRDFNNTRDGSIVVRPILGWKILNNLWMEVSGSPMEQFNLYDVRNNIAFNNLEKIAQSYEVNTIIPLYRSGLRFFVGYRYRSVNSMFFPKDDMLHPVNKQNYQSHTLTGGIIWKL